MASALNGTVTQFDAKTKSGYPYQLARKIIQYLHRRMLGESPTQYVTLLGDSTVVPPSYYFALAGGRDVQVGVTDQCYSSVSQCKEPKLPGKVAVQINGAAARLSGQNESLAADV